jgi:hypothetical protein
VEASGSSICQEWLCIDHLYDELCCIPLLVNEMRETPETHRTIRFSLRADSTDSDRVLHEGGGGGEEEVQEEGGE